MGIDSQRDRDQRVAKLWETLDTHDEGQIDLKGFKKGLRKMDHRTFLSTPRRLSTTLKLFYPFSHPLCSHKFSELVTHILTYT